MAKKNDGKRHATQQSVGTPPPGRSLKGINILFGHNEMQIPFRERERDEGSGFTVPRDPP